VVLLIMCPVLRDIVPELQMGHLYHSYVSLPEVINTVNYISSLILVYSPPKKTSEFPVTLVVQTHMLMVKALRENTVKSPLYVNVSGISHSIPILITIIYQYDSHHSQHSFLGKTTEFPTPFPTH
jgi:hypothetical protein